MDIINDQDTLFIHSPHQLIEIAEGGLIAVIGIDECEVDFVCSLQEFRQGMIDVSFHEFDVLFFEELEMGKGDVDQSFTTFKSEDPGFLIVGQVQCVEAHGSAQLHDVLCLDVADNVEVQHGEP